MAGYWCLAVSLCRPRYAVSRPLSCIVAADVTASECAYVYDECAFTLWQLLPFFIGAVIDVMEQMQTITAVIKDWPEDLPHNIGNGAEIAWVSWWFTSARACRRGFQEINGGPRSM